MQQPSIVSEAVDALVARVGMPSPGRPGVVVAAPGAGKTPLLLHLAERAAADGHGTLVLALGTTLAHLRAQHAAIVQTGWAHPVEVQRRLLLLAVPGTADVSGILKQVRSLRDGGFEVARLVVDGLPATAGALGALAEGSRALGVSAWAALTLSGSLSDDLRVLAGPVVHLEGDGATVHLRDGDGALLPWSLDATTLRVGADEGAVSSGRLRVLHGGAEGAEAAFGEAAVAAGHEERTLTWAGRMPARAESLVVLDEDALGDVDKARDEAEAVLGRTFDSRTLRRVLRLQASLAEAADEVLVVGALQDDGTVSGGTGWAVEVARRRGRRVWVFDQPTARWVRWTGAAWVDEVPTLAGPVVCGTGTRHLTDAGRAAIRAVLGAS